MNQRKNTPAQAHATNQMRGQPTGQTCRPGVMPPQKGTPTQKPQPVAAPSVSRPSHAPKAVQPKIARVAPHAPALPKAPSVYRPQAKRVSVQAKMASSVAQLKNHPVAPPVYQPQTMPKVLQTKKTASQPAGQKQQAHNPLAQPVAGMGQPRKFPVQAKSASNISLHKTAQKNQQLLKPETPHVAHAATRRHPVQPKMTNPRGGSSAIQRGITGGHGNGSGGVVQRYPTLDDSGRLDALIYCISTNDLTEIIYVGQTTDKRAGDRFIEHVTKDKWAPWYFMYGNYYLNDESKWPYRVRTLEALKAVTKFETTAAEQWWLEKYLKEGKKLLNDSTPCSVANFEKRSVDPTLYDPKNIAVAASWKPSMKAK